MCGDCERPIEAVIANKPKCRCAKCHVGGSVLAVQHPPGMAHVGPAPWCVGCHHFILVGHQREE